MNRHSTMLSADVRTDLRTSFGCSNLAHVLFEAGLGHGPCVRQVSRDKKKKLHAFNHHLADAPKCTVGQYVQHTRLWQCIGWCDTSMSDSRKLALSIASYRAEERSSR